MLWRFFPSPDADGCTCVAQKKQNLELSTSVLHCWLKSKPGVHVTFGESYLK